MKDLKVIINQIVSLSEQDADIVISHFYERRLTRGQLLLKKGQVASHYYFLRSGGLRFSYRGEVELTAWIVQPGEFFTEISSLSPEIPTRFDIEAIENSEIYCISKLHMEALYKEIPAWQEFGRKTWERMAIRMINEIIRFQTMTVEERYLEFLKIPGFMQLVSVKQLASYLGITPNALSRIRKNLR